MTTAVIAIGNSDNKLTQAEWAHYCAQTNDVVLAYSLTTHFMGSSPGMAPYQNACWVFEMHVSDVGRLRRLLQRLAANNLQDSIALILGDTDLVEAEL